ncbi:MAG: hypothetical protein GEU88_06400 [Solirubrobacterales bacterium]|nr:hypothetical protein [Solirubrobacterales bacterium]
MGTTIGVDADHVATARVVARWSRAAIDDAASPAEHAGRCGGDPRRHQQPGEGKRHPETLADRQALDAD